DAARRSAARFCERFAEVEQMLGDAPYLLGPELSVLDIAWFIYAERLTLAGYPFARLHPALAAWAARLRAHSAFASEIALPPPIADIFEATRASQIRAGRTLGTVCAL